MSEEKKTIDIIDLDIFDLTEEEYNDKLKDAWLRKAHFEEKEDQELSKYYNYEVQEEQHYTLWERFVYVIDEYIADIVPIVAMIGFVILTITMVLGWLR